MTAPNRAERRPIRRGRWLAAIAVVVVVAGGIAVAVRTGSPGDQASARVGSDLHAVVLAGERVFVSGHDGAAYSDQPGQWAAIPSLAGADAMAWSVGKNDIIVGGHEGAYRSTDNGLTFTPLADLPAMDVHAAGASGSTAYLASPASGLHVSLDGGQTWALVSTTGESLSGSLLVDPANPKHVIAADVLQGVVETVDGGRNWKVLGGIEGPIGLNWNPANHQQIVVTAQGDAGISLDGGASWLALPVPVGTAAVSFDPAGRVLAAVLEQPTASLFVSGDLGQSWSAR